MLSAALHNGARAGCRRALIALAAVIAMPASHALAASLALGSVEGAPGSSVTIPCVLTPGAGEEVAALQFDVTFNNSALTFNGIAIGPAAVDANKTLLVNTISQDTRRGLIAGFNRTAIAAGEVATLTFTIGARKTGIFPISLSNVTLSDPNGRPVAATATSGSISTGDAALPHDADTNADYAISLGELVRVIQFYNSQGFHCQAGTEDDFAPGAGSNDCDPYDADYSPRNWLVSLNEILRVIQIYHASGYVPSTAGEDGFFPIFN